MNKTIKIITILLMTMVVVLSTNTQMVFATGGESGTKKEGASSATSVLEDIKTNIESEEVKGTDGLTKMAGSVIALIRVASAVAAVILVAVFGFKFIMGSANEKADYQKSFIPLIVGIVVVFSSTYIAEVLFTTFSGVLG